MGSRSDRPVGLGPRRGARFASRIPFPPDDDLYGRHPEVKNHYGISLGTIALWGETSVLSVGKDALMRVTSNPFYDYMQTRIDSRIGEN